MHVEEVRHVDDVVDDFTAVGVDGRGVPDPVAPLVAERAFDAGDSHVVGRRVALGVVPDEEHAVLVEGLPGARLGQRGDAACVRNLLALAVAAPAPIVERTGNGVALDGALAQVATHVTAVRVEDLDVAFTVGEDDQFGAERLDGVRLAVLEGLRESNAVPSTRKACRRGSSLDLANLVVVGLSDRHDESRPFQGQCRRPTLGERELPLGSRLTGRDQRRARGSGG